MNFQDIDFKVRIKFYKNLIIFFLFEFLINLFFFNLQKII
jgi:hypothetical protein